MINDNVLTVRSFKNERYKTKEYRKKDFKSFLYLSKSEFKKYSKENDVTVAGSVKINQKHYEDIESADNPEKVLGKKYRRHIIGIFQVKQTVNDDSLDLNQMKKFDLYENLFFYHCIGYAYVGSNKFVNLYKFSLIPFLILLLLLLGLLTSMLFPVNDNQTQEPTWQTRNLIQIQRLLNLILTKTLLLLYKENITFQPTIPLLNSKTTKETQKTFHTMFSPKRAPISAAPD